jgi:hypothetical protein
MLEMEKSMSLTMKMWLNKFNFYYCKEYIFWVYFYVIMHGDKLLYKCVRREILENEKCTTLKIEMIKSTVLAQCS